jgi:hypothetical protein
MRNNFLRYPSAGSFARIAYLPHQALAGEVDKFKQRISLGLDLPPRPSATPPVPGGESANANC